MGDSLIFLILSLILSPFKHFKATMALEQMQLLPFYKMENLES